MTQKILIKETLSRLLETLDIKGEIREEECFGTPFFTVSSAEAPLLIGEGGQNLQAINHLLRRIVERQFPQEPARFVVDVNAYAKKHFEELRDRALMGAERVRYFKKEVILQPMNPFERRIVHLALQDTYDIVTESRGEGPHRCVVIKLASEEKEKSSAMTSEEKFLEKIQV